MHVHMYVCASIRGGVFNFPILPAFLFCALHITPACTAPPAELSNASTVGVRCTQESYMQA